MPLFATLQQKWHYYIFRFPAFSPTLLRNNATLRHFTTKMPLFSFLVLAPPCSGAEGRPLFATCRPILAFLTWFPKITSSLAQEQDIGGIRQRK